MLDADTFLLEYDTERAGGLEPLRLVPRGKTVVLGLVTTKQPQLERKMICGGESTRLRDCAPGKSGAQHAVWFRLDCGG